jgi:DNA repair protein RadC
MHIVEDARVERPRERLLALGASALSDAELVAVLLRTGTSGKSALAIAHRADRRFDGVAGLLAAPVDEVAAVRGVGPAKGAEIATVVELARRSLSQEARRRDALASPQAVRNYLRLLLSARPLRSVRRHLSRQPESVARRPKSSFAARWHRPASIRAKSSRPRLRAMPPR